MAHLHVEHDIASLIPEHRPPTTAVPSQLLDIHPDTTGRDRERIDVLRSRLLKIPINAVTDLDRRRLHRRATWTLRSGRRRKSDKHRAQDCRDDGYRE